MSHFQMMKDYIKAPLPIPYQSKVPETLSPYSFAMATDTIDYLPGDILTKIDRAAMSTSLETRIPFLDHRIVEWAWSLPQHFKINETKGKKILHNLLYRYVPKALLERQKQGFDIPVGQWVKDELRDWAEHLMAEDSIKYTGVFHPNKIRRFWESHRNGIFDESFTIWTVLMLQAWMLENKISLS
jgi:asparagine synthase (glutamine-hydrolysing)